MCAGSGTLAAGQQSDHLVMAAALAGWEAARAEVRSSNPLSCLIAGTPRHVFQSLAKLDCTADLPGSQEAKRHMLASTRPKVPAPHATMPPHAPDYAERARQCGIT